MPEPGPAYFFVSYAPDVSSLLVLIEEGLLVGGGRVSTAKHNVCSLAIGKMDQAELPS